MSGSSTAADSQPRSVRFLILTLACLVLFSDYYCQDIPAVLKEAFLTNIKSFNPTVEPEYVFNLLYTVYSLPNIILPFIGGVLVDKIGDRIMTIVFSFLLAVGQFVVLGASHFGSTTAMIAGRFIFGLGGEALNITVMTILYRWFKGSELSFAQGLNVSVARISTVMNYNISPWMFTKYGGTEYPLALGFLCCAGSWILSWALVTVDYFSQKRRDTGEPQRNNSDTEPTESVWSQCKRLPLAYWVVCMITIVLYLGVLPFTTIASGFLTERWLGTSGDAAMRAGRYMSIPFIISACCFPIIGLGLDKLGQRLTLLIAASCLLTVTHITFMFVWPVYPLIMLGLSYSFFGAIVWPTVAYIVDEKSLGTAYGIQTSLQNLGLTISPMIIATIRTNSSNYDYILAFFSFMGFLGILFSIYLSAIDYKLKLRLNEVTPVKVLETRAEADKKEIVEDPENEEKSKLLTKTS